MKKIIYIFTLILIIGCTSEKQELYDRAVEEIIKTVSNPDDIEFDFLGEENVLIGDSSAKGLPYPEFNSDSAYYCNAYVTVSYRINNPQNILYAEGQVVTFRKWIYSDGKSSEWEFVSTRYTNR